jgi:hypothetical protein
VRNHCYDVLKRRRLPTTSLHANARRRTARDFADRRELLPTHDAENQELGRRIGEALATLGEDQRMVFVLREYESLDYSEIAAITGVNEGTVKSRLFRAKEALRQQLALPEGRCMMGPNKPERGNSDHGGDEFLDWNEIEGTFEGRSFPSESEWMDLPAPPIADDFVARTLAALRETARHETDQHGTNLRSDQPEVATEGAAEGTVVGHLLTPDLLAAFKAPEPSKDFVARTLQAVQDDRRSRWRDLLAKYVAPEPSPEFVARTLRALANDGNLSPRPAARSGAHARWGHRAQFVVQTLVPVADGPGGGAVRRGDPAAHHAGPLRTTCRRFGAAVPGLHLRRQPLPAVLAALESSDDPEALPSGGASGMWLLLHREGR